MEHISTNVVLNYMSLLLMLAIFRFIAVMQRLNGVGSIPREIGAFAVGFVCVNMPNNYNLHLHYDIMRKIVTVFLTLFG